MTEDKPYVASVREWMDAAIVNGKYSINLATEIKDHFENRSQNVFSIFDAIASLEYASHAKVSRTKSASKFNNFPLKGLWHKHYLHTPLSSIYKNIENHWKSKTRYEKMIKDNFSGKTMTLEAFSKQLSHRVILDGYKDRSDLGELTGEWIVFAKQDGVSFYLTLGVHGDDEAIWKRCKACAEEFPELKLLQENRP